MDAILRRMRRLLDRALVLGLAAGVAASGCGRQKPRPAARPAARSAPSPCSAASRALIGQMAGTSPSGVDGSAFTATSGALACRFVAPRPGSRPVVVLVGVDTAPQAYARFDRQTVEYSQNVIWAHLGAGAYPRTVNRLGLGAAWFPADSRLLATDGRRLVDVTVTWPGGGPARARRLAEALARGYLT